MKINVFLLITVFLMQSSILTTYAVLAQPDVPKASLKITVRDALGNLVSEASVMLYRKEKDYINETHEVQKGITNKHGFVKFKALQSTTYYVIVRKENLDNSGGGERISTLKNGSTNKITIIIQ